MEIDVIEVSDRYARFIIKGVSPAFANGLRRSMLAETPVMAIDEINLYDNTSVLTDEQLALRLALIPIRADDIDTYNLPGKCICHGEGCPQCQVSFTLSAEGPGMVYSGHLVSTDPSVRPAEEEIPIIELKEEQKLVLEAIARPGLGRDHAKWQAGVACAYKYLPIITIDSEKCERCEECIKACPKNILEMNLKSPRVTDPLECTLCKLCEKECHPGALKVSSDPNTFIFRVETTGALTAEELALKAAESIKKRTEELQENLTAIE